MILWTPMPLEAVLDGFDAPPRPAMEIRHGNLIMVIEPVTATRARIARIISSDPADYLNPLYEPGRTITLAPVGL